IGAGTPDATVEAAGPPAPGLPPKWGPVTRPISITPTTTIKATMAIGGTRKPRSTDMPIAAGKAASAGGRAAQSRTDSVCEVPAGAGDVPPATWVAVAG